MERIYTERLVFEFCGIELVFSVSCALFRRVEYIPVLTVFRRAKLLRQDFSAFRPLRLLLCAYRSKPYFLDISAFFELSFELL